jgi:NAD(P)-dependent dehydrogenase (short-subunit alcohol dehydrogenase family)
VHDVAAASAETPVIVVIGAAGGMGRATTAAVLERGARVVALGRDPATPERLGALVAAYPEQLEVLVGDATEARVVAGCIELAEARWSRFDGIFNAASIQGPIAPLTEYADEDFDAVMRANVRIAWQATKLAIPALRARGGGAILNTSSTGGLRGWPGIGGYIASKHAVVGLTKTAALECAGDGIRVNVLCPGPTDTPLLGAFADALGGGDPAAVPAELARTVPVGRIGAAREIGDYAAWLLLEAPAYLTGAVLTIDGAQTAGVGQFA